MADHNYLPNDLLTSILKRLPPKTLIKFLTVSKSWYSLITSPNFIASHLHHHNSLSILHPNHHLFLLESHSRYSLFQYGNPFFRRTFLPAPPGEFGSVVASLNGLICLFNSKQRILLLWNPTIHKYRQIEPPISHSCSNETFVVAGVGYNPVDDDYKIVLIDYDRMFVSPDTPPYAQVYSFNGGVNLGWKMVSLPHSFPYNDLSHISESCFVNNSIHWIVFRGGIDHMNNDNGGGITEFGAAILTFDPINDCFGEMQLPKVLNQAVDPDLCLAVIGDSLAVLHLAGGEELQSKYSAIVWIMDEYGVEESWKVLYRIKLPYIYGTNSNLWDKEEGKVFITTSLGTLIVFNINSGSCSVFDGEVAMIGGQAFGYTESLVLLNKFSEASWL